MTGSPVGGVQIPYQPKSCFQVPLLVAVLSSMVSCFPHVGDIRAVQTVLSQQLGQDVVVATSAMDASAQAQVEKLVGEPIGVDQAAQLALLSSPRLLGDLEILALARSELIGAVLPPNPAVELEIQLPSTLLSGFEVSVHEDLGELIRLPMRVAAASSSLQAARAEAAGAVLDVAFSARAAWIELAAAEAVLTMHEEVVKATSAGYELARRMEAVGNLSSLELANERILHEDAVMSRDRAALAVAVARPALRVAMGMKPNDAAIALAGTLPEPAVEAPEMLALRRAALESNLKLSVLEARYQAAGHGAHLAVAESLIDAHVGFRSEREEDGTWSNGPTFELVVPLFDHGEGELSAARSEMRRLRYESADYSARVDAAVRSAVSELATHSNHAVRYREVLLPLHEQVVAETLTRYNGMLLGVFELLQVRRMRTDASRRYLETVRDYWLVRARLDCILAGHLPADGAVSRHEVEASTSSRSSGGH